MRPRLSYANVTATLALMIALGGTSYAAVTITGKQVRNGSLTGADVRRDSLTGRQIRESSLGAVRSAERAQVAGRADAAADAATLGGRPADAFQAAGSPAGGALAGVYPNPTLAPPQLRFLGASPPLFQNGWSQSNAAAFWKDGAGVVHLQGNVFRSAGATTQPIFNLPPGFRPPVTGSWVWAVGYGGTTVGLLEIAPASGAVSPASAAQLVNLNGVSFIAGS